MCILNPSILLLLYLSSLSPGNLCMSFVRLEEEHFAYNCRVSEQAKGYTVNWYREKEGKLSLIQEGSRIVSNGTSLQFWPAVLNDTGNYVCSLSNETHNVIHTSWSLNILQRNKGSCYNAEYVKPALNKKPGRGYTFECRIRYHSANIVNRTWYKNCTPTNERDLHIQTLSTKHSGFYTCVALFVHARKRYNITHTTKLEVKEDTEEYVEPKITGSPNITVETEIGKDVVLNCTAFLGYSNDSEFTFYWLHDDKHVNACKATKDNVSPCKMEAHTYELQGKKYTSNQLLIKNVKEEDLGSSYKCVLNPGTPQILTYVLKKGFNPDLPFHVFTTGLIMAILFSLVAVCVMIVLVVFRVDLVLLYRDVTGKDETLEDGKIYDAFVSYLKDSVPICDEERTFVLDILPKMLEEHFGYKLCIFERDVSPGGAVIDDVQSCIDKSRRLIIILSKNYISNKVMFELETGLHKALVDKKIKIILIEYVPKCDFNFLPKSLDLLSSSQVVKWKEEKSLPLNSRFWKKLRYAMPAKSSTSTPTTFCGLHPRRGHKHVAQAAPHHPDCSS